MSELRDIPFQELLNQTAEHCGLDSERLSVSEGRGLATFLTTACREMLRENDWPGIVATEARSVDIQELVTASGTAYTRGDVRRFTYDGVTTLWRCTRSMGDYAGDMEGESIGLVALVDNAHDATHKAYDFATDPQLLPGAHIYDASANLGVVAYTQSRISTTRTTVVLLSSAAFAATLGTDVQRVHRPDEVPAYWEAYTAPLRIAYEQTGKTPMLDILAIYESDPASTTSPAQVSYTIDETGILLDPEGPGDVWIQFRKPSPRFTIALYSSSKAYVVGDLAVAWPHCYRCIQAGTNKTPATETTYWQVQTLPEKVGESVSLYAAEKWLRSLGNHGAANALRGEREDALDRASRVRNRQEGQTRTYSVATRNNSPAHNYRPRRAALR